LNPADNWFHITGISKNYYRRLFALSAIIKKCKSDYYGIMRGLCRRYLSITGEELRRVSTSFQGLFEAYERCTISLIL